MNYKNRAEAHNMIVYVEQLVKSFKRQYPNSKSYVYGKRWRQAKKSREQMKSKEY